MAGCAILQKHKTDLTEYTSQMDGNVRDCLLFTYLRPGTRLILIH